MKKNDDFHIKNMKNLQREMMKDEILDDEMDILIKVIV